MELARRSVSQGDLVVCLSDIHGNAPALEAVLREAPVDTAALVVVHGDVVNRGPRSDLVWDMLRDRADHRWVLSSGNHERYVRNHLDPDVPPRGGILARVHRSSAWTAGQLGDRAKALFGLPDGVRLEAPGLPEARVVHASMTADDRGVSPESSADDAARDAAGPWAVLVVGHLHRRYDFVVNARNGRTRVVNAGSVGSSCDGVRLAGWTELRATLDGWQVDLRRTAYDADRTEDDFRTSGFLDGAGPVARLVHAEWRHAQPLVQPWMRTELDRVMRGEVDLDASIDVFLAAALRDDRSGSGEPVAP